MSLPQYAPVCTGDEKIVAPSAETQALRAEAGAAPQPRRACKKHRVIFRGMLMLALIYFTASSVSFPSIFGCHRHAAELPSHFTLPSGSRIPSVALGVWKASRGEVGQAVQAALDVGYRHIDDARVYNNEEEVGAALLGSGVKREDVWLTSKLPGTYHDPQDVEKSVDESLAALNTTYLDLFLIHFPVALFPENGTYNEALTENMFPTWQAMEQMVVKGKVRNIGISNFNIWRTQKLLSHPNITIAPVINQVELNFFNPQPGFLAWMKEHNILVEAYSPLGGEGQVGKTLGLPIVQDIATHLDITPAQVIISWHVQRGTVVLPKSVTPSRIEENLKITRLPDALFEKLEAAAVGHKPERTLNPSQRWGLPYDIFD